MKLLTLASLFACSALALGQQTATYTFSTSNPGPYAPITGGLVLESGAAIDDTFYNNVPVGFDFPFGGTAAGSGWTNVIGVSTNGWIKCSSVAGSGTTYNFASSTAQARTVGAFGRDLQAADAAAEVRVETIGSAPNRVCVIQWNNMRPWTSATANSQILTMSFDFQVKLYETTGVIELAYGDWLIGSTAFPAATTSGSVGIKGNAAATVTDYKLCTSSSAAYTWQAPFTATGSAANGHYVGTGAGKKPDNGRVYTYTPGAFPPAQIGIAASASPNTFFLGGNALITAAISLAPASAQLGALSVVADTTSIGGGPGTPMFDDGATSGDVTAGDGIWSVTVPVSSTTPALITLPISAADGINVAGAANALCFVYTLANDFPAGAVVLNDGANGPFDNTNTLAQNAAGFSTPCGLGSSGAHDLFFLYTPSCTGTVDMTTCNGTATTALGELNDSQIVIYDPAGAVIGCNDDANGTTCGTNGYQSTVTGVPVTAGQVYLVRVAGYGTADIGFFNIFVTPHSAIAASSGAGCSAGGNVLTLTSGLPVLGTNFTVDASGANPFDGAIMAFDVAGSVVINFGCDLYLNPLAAQLIPAAYDGFGNISIPVSLPAVAALCGASFDLQAFCLPAAGGFGTSNKRTLTFGF